MDENLAYQNIYETCKQHMHSYVLVETMDGLKTDGIITGLDEENLYLAVPLNQGQESAQQFPNQFGAYPDPFYGPGFGFGYGSPRRFQRLVIPLAFLATLSLLPWY
ncbi:hypothetical protein ACFSKI_17165 [Pseudogracilibacillus auburnensis]|uniref:Uncharacterized protein n=1 Tax=Pseudogracilibacillus auburnensis TaxID=1494959 RepID=A0A2V3WKQ9_9BACI|nr:hypothetical protein [Pseudogracilibacillus auburnensis]MBO1003611.1 hypothetical protein [Pseudogracilibacillus auburnensis]PXW89299.1 hypothetical protein DFR56_10275 [Pseudogracilibacillus auburnensis]